MVIFNSYVKLPEGISWPALPKTMVSCDHFPASNVSWFAHPLHQFGHPFHKEGIPCHKPAAIRQGAHSKVLRYKNGWFCHIAWQNLIKIQYPMENPYYAWFDTPTAGDFSAMPSRMSPETDAAKTWFSTRAETRDATGPRGAEFWGVWSGLLA